MNYSSKIKMSIDPNLNSHIKTLKAYLLGFFIVLLGLIIIMAVHLFYNYSLDDKNTENMKTNPNTFPYEVLDGKYVINNSNTLTNQNNVNSQDRIALFLIAIILIIGILLFFTLKRYLQLIDYEQLYRSLFVQVKTIKNELAIDISTISNCAQLIERLERKNVKLISLLTDEKINSTGRMNEIIPNITKINASLVDIAESIHKVNNAFEELRAKKNKSL
jgi:hypothetical protein